MKKKYGNQDEEDKQEIMEFFDFKEVNTNVTKKKGIEQSKYSDFKKEAPKTLKAPKQNQNQKK